VHKNAHGFLLFCGPGESCKTKNKQNIKKAFLSQTKLIIPTTATTHNPWKPPPAKEEDL